jgi:hypothetical protein
MTVGTMSRRSLRPRCPRPQVRLAAVCAATLIFGLPTVAQAAPFTPTSDDVVLENRPDLVDPIGRELRQRHRALAAGPTNMLLAIEVAELDIDRGRILGDPRFYGHAEAALAPWYDGSDIPPKIRLLRAILRQATHDFSGALGDLDIVLKREPRNGQAHLTRAVIDAVEADYPAALRECGELANLADSLAPVVCTASIGSLTGHARESLEAIRQSLDSTYVEGDQVRVWALTVMAEIAVRLGVDDQARTIFAEALRARPDDTYLLGVYADFLLDRQQASDVVALLLAKTRIDPLLLRLAIAETQLGSPAARGHIEELRARFEAGHQRGETIHQREEARFALILLQRPQSALDLARANWDVQREPADARILMESALAAGRPEAAAPALAWYRDNNLQDAVLAALVSRLDTKGGSK